MLNHPSVNKLVLKNFRNFETQKLIFDQSIILFTGKNGSGKTNLLESLSLLGRGQSLRNAEFEEMLNNQSQQFTIFAELSNNDYIENIAISFEQNTKKKNLEINGQTLSNKRQDLKNYLPNFIFLTPALEQLFISGKSNRRDYLDRIVSDIDLLHQTRLNDYQKLLKERLAILQKYQLQNSANKWLEAIEAKIVESGIAIASARIEALEFFNRAIKTFNSNFPQTTLRVVGEIENIVMKQSSLQIENFYHQKLVENRQIDLQSFKTNFGIHRGDFLAIFDKKNICATKSSTGEQKTIMTAITIARAKISAQYRNQSTILIFDEIVSHLDDKRKVDLLEEIKDTGLQSFFSATDLELIPETFKTKLLAINIT